MSLNYCISLNTNHLIIIPYSDSIICLEYPKKIPKMSANIVIPTIIYTYRHKTIDVKN